MLAAKQTQMINPNVREANLLIILSGIDTFCPIEREMLA